MESDLLDNVASSSVPMRFAVRPIAGGRQFALALKQAQLAEAIGFDGVFVGEHHGSADYWPSPLLVLAAAASATHRVRLGTSILILPLYHPVRLAEELAMLDCVSGGRVVAGFGLGWARQEFDAFNVDYDGREGRFAEAVSLIRGLLSARPTTFLGSHYSIRDYAISPTPIQEPHLPIWLGGRTTSAIRRAAVLADAWVCDDFSTISDLARGMATYHRVLKKLGRSRVVREFPVGRHMVIANSSREAWREAESYFERTYAPLIAQGNVSVAEAVAHGLKALVRDRHIVGDAPECVEMVQRLQQQLGANYLILKFSRRDNLDGFESQARLFLEHVVPRI